MTTTFTLPPHIVQYLASHSLEDDEFLGQLKVAAERCGIPPIWIPEEQAHLIQILLQLNGSEHVLEVGTLAGYSAIIMARALPPEGIVHTLEIAEDRAQFAKDWAAKSDVAKQVVVHHGHAEKLMPGFRDNSMDAIFIDANKSLYPTFLKQALRIVRPKGMILVDNAFAWGQVMADNPEFRQDDVWAIRKFNDMVASHDQVESMIVPIADGMWIMHVKR